MVNISPVKSHVSGGFLTALLPALFFEGVVFLPLVTP